MRRASAFADFLASLRALCFEIDQGKPRPFYLIHGGHEYFAEWAASNLTDHLLPEEGRSERLVVLDCRLRALGGAAEGLLGGEGTLFGHDSWQVLLVKNPPVSGTEVKGSLAHLFTDPPPRTVVIVASGREVPAGSSLFKQIPEQAAVLQMPKMDSEDEAISFLSFLATRNARSRLNADRRVLWEVLARVGSEDPRQLVREMEKLSLYVGSDRPATPDDVRESIAFSAPDNAFTLLAHINAGEPSRALATLDLLLDQTTPHPVILGAIAQELIRLLQARTVLDSGEVNPNLARGGFDQFRRELGEEKKQALTKRLPPERRDNLFLHHPYAIFRSLQQSLRLSREALAEALEAVVESDFQLKTTSQPENQVLERLTLRLCRLIGPAPAGLHRPGPPVGTA